MFKTLFGLFSSDLAVDLGTVTTSVFVPGKGVVLCEPTVMAMREDRPVAFGQEARRLLGRAPHNITPISPIQEGVIAHFTATELWLRHLIGQVHQGALLPPSPRLLLTFPSGATEVAQRALREAALAAEARKVYLVAKPIALALGADLDLEETALLVDLGGETCEVALLSCGGVVSATTLKLGGRHLDRALQRYLQRHHQISVAETTAEKLKLELASAFPTGEVREVEAMGRDQRSGLARPFRISSNEVYEALLPLLDELAASLREVLRAVPPEIGADLVEKGGILAGGGALLEGLDRFLEEEVGIPFRVASEPLTALARGGGKLLELGRRPPYRALLEAA